MPKRAAEEEAKGEGSPGSAGRSEVAEACARMDIAKEDVAKAQGEYREALKVDPEAKQARTQMWKEAREDAKQEIATKTLDLERARVQRQPAAPGE